MPILYAFLLILLSCVFPIALDAFDEHPTHTPRYFSPPLTPNTKELRCLATAIYYEAGNQSMSGQEAVGIVIINRVYHPRYPKTICGVIYQSSIRNTHRICQFSFACQSRQKKDPRRWNQTQEIAKNLLQNKSHVAILHPLRKSLWFHAVYVHPKWAQQTARTMKIGDHIFYQEKQK